MQGKSLVGSSLVARIIAAMGKVGVQARSKNQVMRWGYVKPARNTPNKKANIRMAHARKAQVKLQAKRNRKKITKRARNKKK